MENNPLQDIEKFYNEMGTNGKISQDEKRMTVRFAQKVYELMENKRKSELPVLTRTSFINKVIVQYCIK